MITAGVDEVGRGCLAGPVVSAAVVLKKSINLNLLKDSKKISFNKREEISKHIRNPDGIAIQEIARGRIEIQQVRIPDHSTACGKSLIELNLPERVRVAAIQRAEKSFIPTAEEIIQANDQITLFGDPSKLSKTASTLRSKNEKEKSKREERLKC